ncbi:hypothetical protein KIPB_010463, partial [Kipferlia bialata]
FTPSMTCLLDIRQALGEDTLARHPFEEVRGAAEKAAVPQAVTDAIERLIAYAKLEGVTCVEFITLLLTLAHPNPAGVIENALAALNVNGERHAPAVIPDVMRGVVATLARFDHRFTPAVLNGLERWLGGIVGVTEGPVEVSWTQLKRAGVLPI